MKVVEIAGRTSTRIAGGLLARLGAEVVRLVVDGQGEPDSHPGLVVDELAMESSWDAGKQIEVVTPSLGDDVVTRVCRDADAVLTSGEGGRADGISPSVLGDDLIHVHVTPFGLTGPYAGYVGTELTTAAYGGLAVYVGEADREPIVPPMMLAANLTGCVAAT